MKNTWKYVFGLFIELAKGKSGILPNKAMRGKTNKCLPENNKVVGESNENHSIVLRNNFWKWNEIVTTAFSHDELSEF